MKVLHTDILGTDYAVSVGKRKEIGLPKHLRGQCCNFLKEIKVEHSMRGCEVKQESDLLAESTVAHEVFHAYICESGIDIPEDVEEVLAVWYERQWKKMDSTIHSILRELKLDNK